MMSGDVLGFSRVFSWQDSPDVDTALAFTYRLLIHIPHQNQPEVISNMPAQDWATVTRNFEFTFRWPPARTTVPSELPDSPAPNPCPKGPSRLLNLSAPPESTLVISARNEKESSLLALPSELLNKILQGVVADQIVHILPEGSRKYKTRICASPEDCPTSESPRIHLALDDNTTSDGIDDDSCYTLRHQECEHSAPTKSGLNLDVLLVCRQIYREASLLPFQQNTFVFGLHAPIEGQRPTMAGFINRLKREQRGALRHVTIATGYLQVAETKSQLGQLRGLQSLHMIIAPGNDVAELHWELIRCLTFGSSYAMNWLPLKTFRIDMEAYLDSRGLGALWSQAPELNRLIRYAEAYFLSQNSNTAGGETALREFRDFDYSGVGRRPFDSRLNALSKRLRDALDPLED